MLSDIQRCSGIIILQTKISDEAECFLFRHFILVDCPNLETERHGFERKKDLALRCTWEKLPNKETNEKITPVSRETCSARTRHR